MAEKCSWCDDKGTVNIYLEKSVVGPSETIRCPRCITPMEVARMGLQLIIGAAPILEVQDAAHIAALTLKRMDEQHPIEGA